MNANDIDDIDEDMPFELIEHAKAAVVETLPIKSKEKYDFILHSPPFNNHHYAFSPQ